MNDINTQLQELLAKCWAEPTLKQRLLTDPEEIIRSEGIEIAEGVRFKACEIDTGQLMLTTVPPAADLNDEMLEGIAAGAASSTGTPTFYLHPPVNITFN